MASHNAPLDGSERHYIIPVVCIHHEGSQNRKRNQILSPVASDRGANLLNGRRRRIPVQSLLLLAFFLLVAAKPTVYATPQPNQNVIQSDSLPRGGAAPYNFRLQLEEDRIAHVRHTLNERLHAVKSGKRSKEFAQWVRKTGNPAIVSVHGTHVDYQVLNHNSTTSTVMEATTASAPLFPEDKREMGLVPVANLPSLFPGKPQHLLDDKPPSLFKLMVRAIKLGVKFSPVSTTVWLAFLSTKFRNGVWYSLISSCLASSGPAFIKWGQWAATREDMFPVALCNQLAHLHNEAPAHSWTYTQTQMESSLGLPRGRLLSVFASFDRTPLASGSIAQVHKAVLRANNAADGTAVAVKVRHPHVSRLIDMDFRIMSFWAGIIDSIPTLSWLRVKESVQQFSHTLAAQAHLNVEAHHLEVLNHNFRRWNSVRFPQPFYASSSVIIETFEPGRIVSRILDLYDRLANQIARDKPIVEEVDDDDDYASNGELSSEKELEGLASQIVPLELAKFIVTTGLSIYLKMLLTDNLMHADLHPGNILLELHTATNESPLSSLSTSRALVPLEGQFQVKKHLIITLVDAGMVAQLTESESANFIGILCAIGEGDGVFAAQCALRFSDENALSEQERQAFIDDVVAVFQERCRGYHTNVDVGHVLRGILGCIRDHRVRVDANYATLVVNCLCIESLARRVCPSYNVLDAAKPLLQSYRRMAYTMDGTPKNVPHRKIRQLIPLMNFRKEIQDRAFFSRQRRLMEKKQRAQQL